MARAGVHAVAVAVVLLVASCGGGGSDASTRAAGASEDEGTLTVTAENMAFHPDELKAEPGAEVTVRFENEDDTDHTFTSSDAGIDLKAEPGGTQEATFTAPDSGSVSFQCSIHPAMKAALSVGGEGAASDSDSDSDSDRGGYDY